jgi:LAO/AO transport system kinase
VLVLVLGPDSGDWVQFLKAGVLEVCDVVAVNKADVADKRIATEARRALRLQNFRREQPPVVRVSAESGQGVAELDAAIEEAHAALASRLRRRREEVASWIASEIAGMCARMELDRRIGRSMSAADALEAAEQLVGLWEADVNASAASGDSSRQLNDVTNDAALSSKYLGDSAEKVARTGRPT